MAIIALNDQLAALRVTGADAYSFLQGQFTNDLARTSPAVRYGLWLDHKGKAQADSFVVRLAENEFLLVSYHGPAGRIRAHLERSLVADEVELADETGKWTLLTASADMARKLSSAAGLKLPSDAAGCAGKDGVWCFRGRRAAEQSWEFLIPADAAKEWRGRIAEAGEKTTSTEELERLRIAARIPAVPADIGPGDLPQEGGLDDAISYTKGCFLGQEVMARLKNLGQVRRRLHVLRGAGAPPAPQMAVMQGDKRIGETRSAAADGDGFVALAMLSLVNFNPGADTRLPDGRALTVASEQH